MSADRTAPAPHPDRAWRETFLARFDPDRAELLERFGALLLTLANGGGYLPHRARGAIRGPLVAVAGSPTPRMAAVGGLEHLALCLCEVAATPVHSEVSRPELALCHAASGWADYLEIAVHALRRDAGSERRAPPSSRGPAVRCP